MKRGIAILLVSGTLALTGCTSTQTTNVQSQEETTETSVEIVDDSKPTMAEFEQVELGMTQEEVFNLIGEGTKTGEMDNPYYTSETYEWKSEQGELPIYYVNVSFKDGVVSYKMASGLE